MLCTLTIRNFIIAEAIDLDVQDGLTVLSGETGAGKSIVLEALMLLAGGRADSGQVRHGADKADLSATFAVKADSRAADWLREQELWQDGECVLRRVITADGRSRGFINGSASPIGKLKELGQLLLQIHAQHEHQRLLRPDQHLAVLDSFGRATDSGYDSLLARVRNLYREWRQITQRRDQLKKQAEQDSAERKLMAYQLEELAALELSADELPELEKEQKSLSQAESLLQTASDVSQALNSETGEADILGQLRHGIQALSPHAELNNTLSNALQLLQDAQVQLDEAQRDLSHFAEDFSWDPERLAEVEERLSALYDTARKHHCRPEELPGLQQSLEESLSRSEADESELAELEQRAEQLWADWQEAAALLSERRLEAGDALAGALAQQLQKLNMPHAQLVCQVEGNPERASAQGMDDVVLCLSANPGQPVQPLHKAASGGELSRIALALQVVVQEADKAPTLFFDEVDVGISGATAEEVGRLIRRLSEQSQILCITHLPQVASFGHQHWLIEKVVENQETMSSVRLLSEDDRTREVARLISGARVTDATLAHARDLLAAPTMH